MVPEKATPCRSALTNFCQDSTVLAQLRIEKKSYWPRPVERHFKVCVCSNTTKFLSECEIETQPKALTENPPSAKTGECKRASFDDARGSLRGILEGQGAHRKTLDFWAGRIGLTPAPHGRR